MYIGRREFLQTLGMAALAGLNLKRIHAGQTRFENMPADVYEVPSFGNLSILHITDVHAQLLPIIYREPSIKIASNKNKASPQNLVGDNFLTYYGISPNSAQAYAFTHLNFKDASEKYGKLGGFAHLASLIKHIRSQRKEVLLLDGGDSWTGSATALWTNAQDMVDANLKLGVDIMTGHWEFTYGAQRVKDVVDNDFKGKIDFLAHNVVDSEFEDPVFKPYSIREINGVAVAVIGQAFPYTPISNPSYMVPQWRFGIQELELQKIVNEVRGKGAQIVSILSHNGLAVDVKLASRLENVDIIFGGHSHDPTPKPLVVANPSGQTLVINSGAMGKYLAVLDLEVKNNRLQAYQFKLLPVFSNLLSADKPMQEHINKVRKPFESRLNEKLAVTEHLLYRADAIMGSFDQIILDILIQTQNADIALLRAFALD